MLLGRLQAVHPRHPDVHQHDVGAVLARGGDAVVAVDGLRRRPRCPARRRGSSPARTAPGRRRRRRAPGSARLTSSTAASRSARTTPPSRRVSAGRRPAWRARRGRPGPSPAPGVAAPRTRAAAGRVADPDADARRPASRRRSTSTVDARRVLAGVGQALLHDPVRRAADLARASRAASSTRSSYWTRMPARLGLGTSAARSPNVGCGRSRDRAGSSSRSTPRTCAQVGERLVRLGLDQLGGLPHLVGGQVGAVGQRPGVHGDQADPVGQHVVHLPGDPGALVRPALLDAQLPARPRPARPGRAASTAARVASRGTCPRPASRS